MVPSKDESRFQILYPQVVFGSQKTLRKEKKKIRENDSFMFGCSIKNIKEDKI